MSNMIEFAPRPNFLYANFHTTTKSQIFERMSQYGAYSCGYSRESSYSGVVPMTGKRDFIFLFTAQKFRRKTKVVLRNAQAKKPTVKNGTNASKFRTEEIRRGHWEVRVFKFPLDQVIEAKQLKNTFRVKLK